MLSKLAYKPKRPSSLEIHLSNMLSHEQYELAHNALLPYFDQSVNQSKQVRCLMSLMSLPVFHEKWKKFLNNPESETEAYIFFSYIIKMNVQFLKNQKWREYFADHMNAAKYSQVEMHNLSAIICSPKIALHTNVLSMIMLLINTGNQSLLYALFKGLRLNLELAITFLSSIKKVHSFPHSSHQLNHFITDVMCKDENMHIFAEAVSIQLQYIMNDAEKNRDVVERILHNLFAICSRDTLSSILLHIESAHPKVIREFALLVLNTYYAAIDQRKMPKSPHLLYISIDTVMRDAELTTRFTNLVTLLHAVYPSYRNTVLHDHVYEMVIAPLLQTKNFLAKNLFIEHSRTSHAHMQSARLMFVDCLKEPTHFIYKNPGLLILFCEQVPNVSPIYDDCYQHYHDQFDPIQMNPERNRAKFNATCVELSSNFHKYNDNMNLVCYGMYCIFSSETLRNSFRVCKGGLIRFFANNFMVPAEISVVVFGHLGVLNNTGVNMQLASSVLQNTSKHDLILTSTKEFHLSILAKVFNRPIMWVEISEVYESSTVKEIGK